MNLLSTLEEATEGSRELDAAIDLEIFPSILAKCLPDETRGPGHWIHPQDGPVFSPEYTTSINAALTLVAEGWGWAVTDPKHWPDSEPDDRPYARVYCPDRDQIKGNGPTPALAICIAALRARDLTPVP